MSDCSTFREYFNEISQLNVNELEILHKLKSDFMKQRQRTFSNVSYCTLYLDLRFVFLRLSTIKKYVPTCCKHREQVNCKETLVGGGGRMRANTDTAHRLSRAGVCHYITYIQVVPKKRLT